MDDNSSHLSVLIPVELLARESDRALLTQG